MEVLCKLTFGASFGKTREKVQLIMMTKRGSYLSVFQEDQHQMSYVAQRCLKDLTQNQNEYFKSTLWSICPKTIFRGKRKVMSITAMSSAVSIFNIEASSKATTIKLCGISPGSNAINVFKNHDLRHVKAAAIKITSRYRNCQRELRVLKKSKSDKI